MKTMKNFENVSQPAPDGAGRRRARRPRTGPRRRAAAAAGVALVLFLLLNACATLGDPLSRAYSRAHALDYANENWPGHDFYIVQTSFSPFWNYNVTVQAADSIDTRFTLRVGTGIVRWTDYDTVVAQKINTLNRFNDSLQADVQAAFTAAGFSPFEATDFLVTIGETAELTLDMPYDKGDIAPKTSLFIFGFSDAPGADAAEEILRGAKAVMTEYGIDIDEYCVTMYDGRYNEIDGAVQNGYDTGWRPAGSIA